MFEDYFAKTNIEQAATMFNKSEYNDESTYVNYTDKYKKQQELDDEKNPIARVGVTFTEKQQEKIKQSVKQDYPQLYPGDRIKILPFAQQPNKKNKNNWFNDAKLICGQMVTIKSFNEKEKFYYIKEINYCWNVDEFDYSTLIRKENIQPESNNQEYIENTNPTEKDLDEIFPGDMVFIKSIDERSAHDWYSDIKPQVGDIIEWDNGNLKEIIIVTEIIDSFWFKSNKESYQNKFIKKIICRLGENYLE